MENPLKWVAIPCQHIADYYQRAWENHKCIANNLLRHGYNKWARGAVKVEDVDGWNNLFEPQISQLKLYR